MKAKLPSLVFFTIVPKCLDRRLLDLQQEDAEAETVSAASEDA